MQKSGFTKYYLRVYHSVLSKTCIILILLRKMQICGFYNIVFAEFMGKYVNSEL